MKNVFLIIGFAVFIITGTAQQTKTPGPKKSAVASATPAKTPAATSK